MFVKWKAAHGRESFEVYEPPAHSKRRVFKAGEAQEVPDAWGHVLVARGDFEQVAAPVVDPVPVAPAAAAPNPPAEVSQAIEEVPAAVDPSTPVLPGKVAAAAPIEAYCGRKLKSRAYTDSVHDGSRQRERQAVTDGRIPSL